MKNKEEILLVFDGVLDIHLIETYFKEIPHIHVIITTQTDVSGDIWGGLSFQKITVRSLKDKDGMICLLQDSHEQSREEVLNKLKQLDPAEQKALEHLNSQLGGLPLALTQVRMWIRETGLTFQDFNKKLNDTLKRGPDAEIDQSVHVNVLITNMVDYLGFSSVYAEKIKAKVGTKDDLFRLRVIDLTTDDIGMEKEDADLFLNQLTSYKQKLKTIHGVYDMALDSLQEESLELLQILAFLQISVNENFILDSPDLVQMNKLKAYITKDLYLAENIYTDRAGYYFALLYRDLKRFSLVDIQKLPNGHTVIHTHSFVQKMVIQHLLKRGNSSQKLTAIINTLLELSMKAFPKPLGILNCLTYTCQDHPNIKFIEEVLSHLRAACDGLNFFEINRISTKGLKDPTDLLLAAGMYMRRQGRPGDAMYLIEIGKRYVGAHPEKHTLQEMYLKRLEGKLIFDSIPFYSNESDGIEEALRNCSIIFNEVLHTALEIYGEEDFEIGMGMYFSPPLLI